MNFTVSLSVPSGLTVTVNYATANSTATQPADYTTTSGTLTFTPGQGTKTISVPVVGDALDEIDETFFVNLSGADERHDRRQPRAWGRSSTTTPRPRSRSTTSGSTEGDAGTANMTFTATAVGGERQDVTVDYATADGTATAPGRLHGCPPGTLTFNPEWLTRTFTVPIVGDTTDEFDETFVANLSNPANATIADNQGVGTIVDDDATADASASTTSRPRRATWAPRPRRSRCRCPPPPASRSRWTTRAPTARPSRPADYAGVSGTLAFAPGQVVEDRRRHASRETCWTSSTRRSPCSCRTSRTSRPAAVTGTGTIVDDDPGPRCRSGMPPWRRATPARRTSPSPSRSRPPPASRSRWTTRAPTAPPSRPATTRACRAPCRSRPGQTSTDGRRRRLR